jgi:hypothetical protein
MMSCHGRTRQGGRRPSADGVGEHGNFRALGGLVDGLGSELGKHQFVIGEITPPRAAMCRD